MVPGGVGHLSFQESKPIASQHIATLYKCKILHGNCRSMEPSYVLALLFH